MVADAKKVQTAINIFGQQALIIRGALDRMESVRDLYVAANPDVTGTPLDGVSLAPINTSLANLRTEIDKAAWDQMIAAIVPSHRNAALE